MTKLKAFPLDAGGSISGVAKKVEAQGNALLAENPDIKIEHVAVVPTGSGLSLLLVFYSEEHKKK